MAKVFTGRYSADAEADSSSSSSGCGFDRFARDGDRLHLPAWREWNKRARASGAVGIWHETYKVRAGEYETIYGNMPRVGLAAATAHVPITAKGRTAARRIGATTEDVPAVAYPGE